MKRKKNVIFLIFILILSFLLCGCGNKVTTKSLNGTWVVKSGGFAFGGDIMKFQDGTLTYEYDGIIEANYEVEEVNEQLKLHIWNNDMDQYLDIQFDGEHLTFYDSGYEIAMFEKDNNADFGNTNVNDISSTEGIDNNETSEEVEDSNSSGVIEEPEFDSFDPFEDISINIDGASPLGSISVSSNQYDKLTFTCEPSDMIKNGDVITISVDSDECKDKYSLQPSKTSYEYTVSDMNEYLSSLSQLTDTNKTLMEKVYPEGLRVEATGNPSTEIVEFLGYVLLTAKNPSKDSDANLLFLFSKENLTSAFIESKDFYFYNVYKNVEVYPDGTVFLDTANRDMPKIGYVGECEFFGIPGTIDDIAGYETYEEMYNAKITALKKDYNVEEAKLNSASALESSSKGNEDVKKILAAYQDEIDRNFKGAKVAIIYIDDDDIPEVILDYYEDHYSLLLYNDGKINSNGGCSEDSEYVPRKNYFIELSEYDFSPFSLVNGELRSTTCEISDEDKPVKIKDLDFYSTIEEAAGKQSIISMNYTIDDVKKAAKNWGYDFVTYNSKFLVPNPTSELAKNVSYEDTFYDNLFVLNKGKSLGDEFTVVIRNDNGELELLDPREYKLTYSFQKGFVYNQEELQNCDPIDCKSLAGISENGIAWIGASYEKDGENLCANCWIVIE